MRISFTSLVTLFLISAVLGSGVGYSHLYLFHFSLVLLMGGWVFLKAKGVKQLFPKPKSMLVYFFFLMMLWYLLGMAWSIAPLYTLRYLVYIILGFSIVYIIVSRASSEERYRAIFNVLKWVFIIEIVVAILEIFTPFRLPTSPYSEYAELFQRKGEDIYLLEQIVVSNMMITPTAFHGNPNNLAVVMAALLPFFLFSPRIWIKLSGSLAVLIIIIAADSRGAFIGAVVGFALYFTIKYFKLLLLFILVLMTVLFYLISLNCIDVSKMLENPLFAFVANIADASIEYLFGDDMTHNSISLRQQWIRHGLDVLYSTGGIGVGGGGSGFAVAEIMGGVAEDISMHNFWVEVLVDSGVVFFLVFVFWYFVVSIKILLIYFKSKSSFYRYQSGALFVSFAVFSISCISASTVIYHLPMWIMFGMGLAFINLRASLQTTSGSGMGRDDIKVKGNILTSSL